MTVFLLSGCSSPYEQTLRIAPVCECRLQQVLKLLEDESLDQIVELSWNEPHEVSIITRRWVQGNTLRCASDIARCCPSSVLDSELFNDPELDYEVDDPLAVEMFKDLCNLLRRVAKDPTELYDYRGWVAPGCGGVMFISGGYSIVRQEDVGLITDLHRQAERSYEKLASDDPVWWDGDLAPFFLDGSACEHFTPFVVSLLEDFDLICEELYLARQNSPK